MANLARAQGAGGLRLNRIFRAALRVAPVLALPLQVGTAQTAGTTGTLRYGSGLLDVPVASVLPHLMMTATYSGFRAPVPGTLDGVGGGAAAPGDSPREWFSDGSIALGLFGRVEIGATFQHSADAEEGGRMAGAFARLSLLPASVRSVGLGVGARYVSGPAYAGREGRDYQPTRLGFPDPRFFSGAVRTGEPGELVSTFSPYVVATALLPGFDAGPEYDVTVTAGWGGGMFAAGRDLDFYGDGASGGIFAGSAIHFAVGRGRALNFMVEYNGFDANAGAELDLGGIRVGAFSLGLTGDGGSAYRSRKFGVLGTVAFCVADLGPCRAASRSAAADTVILPAPPPDTVVVERVVAADLPSGSAETLCLATGVQVTVFLTAAGDTLAGPSRVPLADLRPGIGFAGTYAAGRDWFVRGSPVTLGQGSYERSGGPVRPDCAQIVEVGSHDGVPVFAQRAAAPPFDTVYVPVRPGVWQRYSLVPAEAPRTVPGPGVEPRPSLRINSGVRSSAVSMSVSTSR